MKRLYYKIKNNINLYYNYLSTDHIRKNEKIENDAIKKLLSDKDDEEIIKFLSNNVSLNLSQKNVDLLMNDLFNRVDDNYTKLLKMFKNEKLYDKYGLKFVINISKNLDINKIFDLFELCKDKIKRFYDECDLLEDLYEIYNEEDNIFLFNKIYYYCLDNIATNYMFDNMIKFLDNDTKIKLLRLNTSLPYFKKDYLDENVMTDTDFEYFFKNNTNINMIDKDIKEEIFSKMINRLKYLEEEGNIIDYSNITSIFNNASSLDKKSRKALIKILLKSGSSSIIDLFLNKENRLTFKEMDYIIKKITHTKNCFLAYHLLEYKDIDLLNYKKDLFKLLMESKNQYYICMAALFIDNSLIKSKFKSIENLYTSIYRYINEENRDLLYDKFKELGYEININYVPKKKLIKKRKNNNICLKIKS